MEQKQKFSRKLLPAAAYGIAFGALFYTLGAVADAVGGGFLAGMTAPMMGVLGFASAVAIHLARE